MSASPACWPGIPFFPTYICLIPPSKSSFVLELRLSNIPSSSSLYPIIILFSTRSILLPSCREVFLDEFLTYASPHARFLHHSTILLPLLHVINFFPFTRYYICYILDQTLSSSYKDRSPRWRIRLSSSLVKVSFVSSSPAEYILVYIRWDVFLWTNLFAQNRESVS